MKTHQYGEKWVTKLSVTLIVRTLLPMLPETKPNSQVCVIKSCWSWFPKPNPKCQLQLYCGIVCERLQKEIDRLEDQLLDAKAKNLKLQEDMEAAYRDIQNLWSKKFIKVYCDEFIVLDILAPTITTQWPFIAFLDLAVLNIYLIVDWNYTRTFGKE